jgi:hypothetical protein
MIKYFTREELCTELQIDLETLKQYESYLQLPESKDGTYHVSLAKTLSRLHELVLSGLSLNDIRHLSFCAEAFQEQIPALRTFAEFAPGQQLQDLLNNYAQILDEFSVRETQYQKQIINLESMVSHLQSDLQDSQSLNRHVERLQVDNERNRLALQESAENTEQLKIIIQELEVAVKDLQYENTRKDHYIERLKSEISYTNSKNLEFNPQNAIDIESLLKKKEREITIKHQKQIFDLKKQVESMVEKQEWFKSKQKNPGT